MTQAIGNLGYLAFGMEDDGKYGIIPTNPTLTVIPLIKGNPVAKRDTITSSVMRGLRDATQPLQGQQDVTGDIEVPTDVYNIGNILKMTLGAPVTTSVSTSATLTSLFTVEDNVASWTGITDGAFGITIDGTALNLTGITFASATSMADVASKIQAAIRAESTTVAGVKNATVVYDSTANVFVISSGSTGTSSTITVTTAPASGTNISNLMHTGNGSVVAGSASYKHVFSIPTKQPSFFIEEGHPDIGVYSVTVGCKTTKFEITAQTGNNEATATMSVMGQQQLRSSASLVTNKTSLNVIPFENAKAYVMLDGAIVGYATKMSLSLDNGSDGDTFALNKKSVRNGINDGLTAVTGSLTVLFTDSTLLDRADNFTTSRLEMHYEKGSNSLALIVPEAKLEVTTPAYDGPKGMSVSMNFTGFYNTSTEETSIQAILQNDHSAY